MSPALITEVRALICGAMADIGGSCERLRELEDPDLRSAVVEDSREEIAVWLAAAADSLSQASLLSAAGSV